MNDVYKNDSNEYLYEDLNNIYEYIYLSESTNEEKIKNVKNEMKKFLNMLKFFLKKLLNIKGIKELTHVIVTLLESFGLSKFLGILRSESIEEKMERIKTVNNFSDILSLALQFSNISGKILFKLFNFLYLLNPFNAYAHFFEYENKFQDWLQNHDANKLYKYVYDKFVSVGIPEKFAATYICILAFLTPMYILLSMMKLPKDPKFDDPNFYSNPFFYDKENPKTGFKTYEKMIIKSVNKIVNKYQNLENDYDKTFYLSSTILKDFIYILLFMFIAFSPIMLKLGFGINFILNWLNMFLICLVTILLVIHLMITNVTLQQIKKRYKNDT